MPLTITRTAMTDDDGTGTTGTVFNNAWKTALYNEIDALFSVFGAHSFDSGGTGGNTLTVRNTTAGTSNYAAIFAGNDSSATLAYLQAFSSTFTSSGPSQANGTSLVSEGAGGLSIVASNASGNLRFYAGGTTETARLTTGGQLNLAGAHINVGNLAYPGRSTTNPTNAINIYNGTAPAGTLTNGVTLYAASGELRVMDAAGNSTLLSPHDDDGLWVYDSISPITGKHLRVDMEKLVKFIDAQFGTSFVQEADAA